MRLMPRIRRFQLAALLAFAAAASAAEGGDPALVGTWSNDKGSMTFAADGGFKATETTSPDTLVGTYTIRDGKIELKPTNLEAEPVATPYHIDGQRLIMTTFEHEEV